jgi:hypothetical protein
MVKEFNNKLTEMIVQKRKKKLIVFGFYKLLPDYIHKRANDRL